MTVITTRNYAKPTQASRSTLAMAFFFFPYSHFSSSERLLTVLLTTGSLSEATLLAPALTQQPMPLDNVESKYLNIFYMKTEAFHIL